MKISKRQLRRIIREEKQKLINEASWIPSDEEYDAADMYVMADCFEVLELISKKMMRDPDLYGRGTYEDFLMECIEWIRREELEGKAIQKRDYV
mgnify:CR=1 FL=1